MAEAMNGEGCDRHLFGLRLLAQENNLPLPEIYTDSAWTKRYVFDFSTLFFVYRKYFFLSGGDGNFLISTSFIGYSNVWGGVAAMCTDGYGTFYKIMPDRFVFEYWRPQQTTCYFLFYSFSITFFLACWKSGKETDLNLWRDGLDYSLKAVKKLLKETPDQISKY